MKSFEELIKSLQENKAIKVKKGNLVNTADGNIARIEKKSKGDDGGYVYNVYWMNGPRSGTKASISDKDIVSLHEDTLNEKRKDANAALASIEPMKISNKPVDERYDMAKYLIPTLSKKPNKKQLSAMVDLLQGIIKDI